MTAKPTVELRTAAFRRRYATRDTFTACLYLDGQLVAEVALAHGSALEAGARAAVDGGFNPCPYSSSRMRAAWFKGFNAARRAAGGPAKKEPR
jgi:ribosome modulation factor